MISATFSASAYNSSMQMRHQNHRSCTRVHNTLTFGPPHQQLFANTNPLYLQLLRYHAAPSTGLRKCELQRSKDDTIVDDVLLSLELQTLCRLNGLALRRFLGCPVFAIVPRKRDYDITFNGVDRRMRGVGVLIVPHAKRLLFAIPELKVDLVGYMVLEIKARCMSIFFSKTGITNTGICNLHSSGIRFLTRITAGTKTSLGPILRVCGQVRCGYTAACENGPPLLHEPVHADR